MALRTYNQRSNDRILVLAKLDPNYKDYSLLDPQIFEGKNNLRIVMDPQTLLWSFKYDRGVVPPALRNKYTSFAAAKAEADLYFIKKRIMIVEVKD